MAIIYTLSTLMFSVSIWQYAGPILALHHAGAASS
jgi:hypothetical protein